MSTSPLAVQSLRMQLFANGFPFVPVITGDKKPISKQWPQTARSLTTETAAAYPDGAALSSGILADGLVPIDFDREDRDLSNWIMQTAQQKLGWAPIRFRSNSAKWLMLYRSTEEQTRSSNVTDANGKQLLEVLGQGKQFVAYGVHPSGVSYEWAQGFDPKTVQRNSLTAITPAMIADFLEEVARKVGGNASHTKQKEVQPVQQIPDALPVPNETEHRMATSVLDKLCAELRSMQMGGRNKALNDAALQLGELCAGWGLDRELVAQSLLQASVQNGLVNDDGIDSVKATIASGFSKGLTQPRARIVELSTIDISNLKIGGIPVSAYLNEPKPSKAKRNSPAMRGGRSVLLTGLAGVQEAAVEWHWPGYLPAGMLTLLSGAGGTGKSTLAFGFAATITTGGLWPDGQRCASCGNVLIWSSEDDIARTIKPRLMAAGADINRIGAIESTTDSEGRKLPFDPAIDIDGLRTAVRQIGGISLLIIDPIVSAVSGDMHKANDVRRSLQPIVDFAAEFNCAVLGITHFAKNTSGRNASERVIGSQAFAALARMVLVTAKEEGSDARVFTRAKSNISADDGGIHYTIQQVSLQGNAGVVLTTTRVVWGPAIQGNALAILSSVEGEENKPLNQVEEAERFLKVEVAGGAVPAREIMERAKRDFGINERSLQRARERLGIIATKTGYQGAWVWSYRITPHFPG